MPKSEHLELTINKMPASALHANPSNARTHSKRQIRQIAESITAFGFTNPVLVDKENRILAGHGRVEAAKLLGIAEVPTITLDRLTTEQIRAYVVADNKLAELAGWNREIRAIELQERLAIEDLDVTVTGFEVAEIDLILEEVKQAASVEEAPPEPQLDRRPVTLPGDLWLLGMHRIVCGNSPRRDIYQTLMGSRRAAMAFIDPPYNVRIDGHATGNGAIRHREFAIASGEMTEAEFVAFLSTALGAMASFSAGSALHFICMDWRHFGELLAAGRQNYDELVNLCVWVKDVGGMGILYRSQHELIAVFRNSKSPHRNNIQLGRFGRNRTNVWRYPG